MWKISSSVSIYDLQQCKVISKWIYSLYLSTILKDLYITWVQIDAVFLPNYNSELNHILLLHYIY